jgi:hypothetical protein
MQYGTPFCKYFVAVYSVYQEIEQVPCPTQEDHAVGAESVVESVCQEIEQVPCPTQEDHAVRAENVVERRESRGRTGSLALSGGPRRRS